jgi:branched-subunit amino acid aminotransferase/4-amino-4-deoxychorismate lyase
MKKNSIALLNGKQVDENQATISPFNRGMMYGDGCFETFRSYAGKFLGWEKHFKRLRAGLGYLEMDVPFTSQELKEEVTGLIVANHLAEAEAMIRIQCWREGSRGYLTSSRKAAWMVQVSEAPVLREGLKLTLAETRCIPSKALERKHKLSNGLNYIKAAQEAKKDSCDDALMLTVDDKVSETTSANIFWIIEDQVFTPSEECDLLPGVTRAIVIDLIERIGIPLQIGKFDIEAIKKADAVFCTNSLKEIAEIKNLDEIEFEMNHPVTQKILSGFNEFKEQELRG